MDEDEFRRLALDLPGVTESAHGGHPDFRLGKRVIATLGYPGPGWAMVKLAPEQQAMVVAAEAALFSPANGAWGKAGATVFQLRNADAPTIRSALDMAWTNQRV